MIRSRLTALFLFPLIAGCSKFGAQKSILDGAFFTKGDSSLTPASDKLSADCFGDPDFDACLYFKNPVAQEKAAVTYADKDDKRRFGVKIRGLHPTGYLENNRIKIFALHAPRFHLGARSELKAASQEQSRAVEQFSAYYWSNRLFDYLEARVGAERLPIKDLKIYADDAFTGYSVSSHSVHLESREGRFAKAVSGEVVIHVVGQALAQALSGNKLLQRNPANHNICALDPRGCCTTAGGCAQALASGFGEYVAAMMFPASAKTGETIGGSVDGQKICGISRDLATLSGRTKEQVFAACQPEGRAPLLGAWYASVWWKLRGQLEAQEPGAAAEVDRIFFDHMRALTSLSTFAEAKTEALRLAGQSAGGKYLTAFTAAFGPAF